MPAMALRPLAALALASLLAACARPERTTTHADWMREATRVWPGETKARVIAAAEAVLKQADPRDTQLEYSKQGFVARRKFFIYALIATVDGEDRWTFHASENAEGASASVRIVERGTAVAGRTSERFRENQVYVGSFRLFWARVEHLLGRRPDWIRCSEAVAKLNLPAEAPGLQALCSLTHQGADAPPPAVLPPKTTAAPAARKGPPEPPQISASEDGD
jgi:hypothetical protein